MDIWLSLERLFYIHKDTLSLGIGVAVLLWLGYILFKSLQRSREKKREQLETRSPERLAELREQARRRLQQSKIEYQQVEANRLAAIREEAKRVRAEQAAAEAAAAKRLRDQQEEMDRAIAEWNAKVQSEEEQNKTAEIAAAKAAAAAIEEKINEVDKSLAEWQVQAITRGEVRAVPRSGSLQAQDHPSNSKISVVKEQILLISRAVGKEVDDLEYVINKMQTGIDFLPIQVQQTINRWKDGQIYRRSTLDDLKLKFRYQAYSIDDGLELFYMYSDWIVKQRQRLLKFISALGTEPTEQESLIAAIERAEKNEWSKNLDINMDVIASLKEIRDIYQITINMEHRLKDLEKACKKRSAQIIQPQWEPKGLL